MDSKCIKCSVNVVYVRDFNSYFYMFTFIDFFMIIWFKRLIFTLGVDKYITYFTIVVHLIRNFIIISYQLCQYHKETKYKKFYLSLSDFCFYLNT